MSDLTNTTYYDNTESDMKLRFFLERGLPHDIATDDIKLRTHLKISRHRRRRTVTLNLLAFAACLAMVVVLVLPRDNSQKQAATSTGTATVMVKPKVKAHVFRVPVGKVKSLLLPDGTKVIANSRTVITYPERFTGDNREITINGEAYLEVAHDSHHPFIVHGNGFGLKVLGTKFNVMTYKGKPSSVALIEGAVEVKTRDADVVRMHPNNIVYMREGAISEMVQANATDFIAWTDGVVKLSGQTVEQVASTLEDYYGVSIMCSPEIAGIRLYGKLRLSSNYQKTLDHVAFLSDSQYTIQDTIISLKRK